VNRLVDVREVADILLDQTEPRVVLQRSDISPRSRQKAVDAYHPVPRSKQGVAEMRADKAGSASHEDSFGLSVITLCNITFSLVLMLKSFERFGCVRVNRP
jgi:hypothetical protein